MKKLTKSKKLVPGHLETMNFIPIDGKNVPQEEILNACQTVPFLSQKLVVVYDAPFFESGKEMRKSRTSRMICYIDFRQFPTIRIDFYRIKS